MVSDAAAAERDISDFLSLRIVNKSGFVCRRTLSTKDKHEYISAVKCLATKPSQAGNIYAGAKSRYDDFQVSHIVNTDFIHYVVSRRILIYIMARCPLTVSCRDSSKRK